MSIFKPGKMCVASEIQVVVTRAGQPVSRAAVQRKVDWHGVGVETDTATTDDAGTFQFPAKYMQSVSHGVLPEELVAATQIFVEVGGEMQEILLAVKRYHKEGAEFGGHVKFRCEINDETRVESFGASVIETRCRWE